MAKNVFIPFIHIIDHLNVYSYTFPGCKSFWIKILVPNFCCCCWEVKVILIAYPLDVIYFYPPWKCGGSSFSPRVLKFLKGAPCVGVSLFIVWAFIGSLNLETRVSNMGNSLNCFLDDFLSSTPSVCSFWNYYSDTGLPT